MQSFSISQNSLIFRFMKASLSLKLITTFTKDILYTHACKYTCIHTKVKTMESEELLTFTWYCLSAAHPVRLLSIKKNSSTKWICSVNVKMGLFECRFCKVFHYPE